MVRRADRPFEPGDNRGNGVRSGLVDALFLSHGNNIGHIQPAAQVLLELPLAGQAALVLLAFGLGWARLALCRVHGGQCWFSFSRAASYSRSQASPAMRLLSANSATTPA